MAARTRKIRHDAETRDKIQASQLVNRLTAHALGNVDMKPTQVTAALGLLRKVIPDLAATEISGAVTIERASEMSDAELAAIAARGGEAAAAKADHPPVTH